MAVDSGSIYSEIRIKLDSLNSDIKSVLTDFDKLGEGIEKKSKESAKGFDVLGFASQAFATAFGFGLADIAGKLKDWAIEMFQSMERANEIIGKATGKTGEDLKELNDIYVNVLATGVEQGSEEIAAALGELSVRLDLTGKALENATVLMAQFADVTNTNVKDAVVGVSKVMNKWNIEAANLPDVLDKLTIASQKSGIPITELTNTMAQNASQMKLANFTFDESIALLAGFEKAGVNSSQVMMAINKAASEMAKNGKDSKEEIKKLFDAIKNGSDDVKATGLAVEVFGTRGGPELAQALRSGKFDIDEWTKSIANAKGVVQATDAATATSADTMAIYANKTKAATAGFFKQTGENAKNTFNGVLATASLTSDLISGVFNRLTKNYFTAQEDMTKGLSKLQTYVSEQTTKNIGTQIQIVRQQISAAWSILDKKEVGRLQTQLDNLLKQEEISKQAEAEAKKSADAILESYQVTSEKTVDTAQDIADQKAAIEKEYAKKIVSDKLKLLEMDRDDALASAKKVGASTVDIEKYYADEIAKLKDEQRKEEEDKQLESIQKIAEEAEKYAELGMGAIFGILDEMNRQALVAIEDRYKAELEANGLAEDSAVEKAEKELQSAIDANDAEAISEAQLALKKAQIDEKYQKEKAKLEYESAMNKWAYDLLAATSGVVKAVIDAGILTPLGIANGIAGAVQIGLIAANQPKPPSFATGGIVLPSGSGTNVNVAENGSPELLFNGGASGQAFVNQFAEAVGNVLAKKNGSGNGTTRAIITINGKQIEAEIRNIIENGSRDGAMKIYDSVIVKG